MSSLAVRQVIRDQLTANWPNTAWYDLSDYVSIEDIPNPETTPFVLLQFVGGTDTMVSIAGQNKADGYREDGIVYLHYVYPTGFQSMGQLVEMETLRGLFKNRRFGDVVIENVDPFTDQDGASIEVDGGFHGWSSTMSYYTDTDVL